MTNLGTGMMNLAGDVDPLPTMVPKNTLPSHHLPLEEWVALLQAAGYWDLAVPDGRVWAFITGWDQAQVARSGDLPA